MTEMVRTERAGAIAVIAIDNPPVNALNADVRRGLADAIGALANDGEVRGIVLTGQGQMFSGGADIGEFGKAAQSPGLPEVCNLIEACPKPVVAAIHGKALGGGFEIALAAHHRIADQAAEIGLPEIRLGLLPGAGGTQRAPRLAGAEAALELMTGGQPMRAPDAKKLGFLDRIAGSDLREAAIALANEVSADGAPPRPTRDRRERLIGFEDYHEALRLYRVKLAGNPVPAALRIVECVEMAQVLPFDAGLEFERTAFLDCMKTEASKALRHIFTAERRTAKFPGLSGVQPRQISEVGVVGGGTMGAGIAAVFLNSGYRVFLVERDEEALTRAEERLIRVYEPALRKGRLSEEEVTRRLSRFRGSEQLASLAGADLVIEAIVEDMEAKTDLFTSLSEILKPNALVASNTSYLDIDELAGNFREPENVLGLHFFSPADRMRLLEVVVGKRTTPDVVATGLSLAKRLGKIPVRSAAAEGFIGNRLLTAYRTAADYMLEDGMRPYEIDQAMQVFGFPLGPYQVLDLAGLDISWARRKRLAPTRDPDERYVTLGDRLCEKGWLGRKTKQGYYRYSEPGSLGEESPEVLALISEIRREKGIVERTFVPDEIQDRCLLAMVAAGARLVEEGVATRPSDIDVAMVHGFGFPRWRGGPMQWADMRGLLNVRHDLDMLAGEALHLWKPAAIFDTLIKNGRTFGSLNAD